jgi:electron-transferring-flavoprotein dehydrogenase
MSDNTRNSLEVDIACVGFGPATAGFLKTINKELFDKDGKLVVESKVVPGIPPQIICYERADDIGFGVSGVVTRGKAIRESLPDFDPTLVPTACEVENEKVVYLFDPHGNSHKSWMLKLLECFIRPFSWKKKAFSLPWIPKFLHKKPGYIFGIGQFCSWVGQEIMSAGTAQIWPGTPVAKALIRKESVKGVRLIDQGVDKDGKPDAGYMPGMDIKARLTVVADGPVGTIGRQLDEHFGLPEGNEQNDWALGMKALVQLPEGCPLKQGTVLHTLGYPEPEIFGYMYVYPDNMASLGIFVPSWFDNPTRTAYRYLQHWMQHPYLWQYLEGGELKSWGAKSLGEWGKHGEPHLVGNGYARIGEGSGSTNVLTNSGVDEAWKSGSLLAESVIELLKNNKPFTKANLEKTYVQKRRESWLEKDAIIAMNARNGFQKGFIRGMWGIALAGITNGKLYCRSDLKRPQDRIPSLETYYGSKFSEEEIEQIKKECEIRGVALHDAFMDRLGWPQIPYDGKLLISQQDALLLGGKVTANPGYEDHVGFKDTELCKKCESRVCVDACSGEAIQFSAELGVPFFEREKCIHCGACLWNCSHSDPSNPQLTNVIFKAGSGGLHSAEN